ncbi:MAG: glycoside hydrolase family 3 C-terminal domain-containing protein [Bacteroidetes bacterium]|nr:glycoside hydrolase family 3 C-terminal domain-containing protein [Bacteroidota bacterium]
MIKKVFKILGLIVLVLAVLGAGGLGWIFYSAKKASTQNLSQLGPEALTISINGKLFRDLNKNGKLDVYEDTRAKVEDRVANLLSLMTLEEKAGTMFFSMIKTSSDGELAEAPEFGNLFSFMLPANSEGIVVKKINHFNLLQTPHTEPLAIWYNKVQKIAERTRLGIPITLGTDPRNHFTKNEFASLLAGDFSLWPEPLGFAAIGDSVLMKDFANSARQEYRAVGITLALHPMADLATEPRWSRINGTFGEDAKLTSKLVYAYIKGFQGDSLSPASVICMTKHFSGGGPQKEGLDPHFQFQKGQVYPGKNFNYHLIPFEAAFKAGTAQIMPYYGVPMDQTSENVGFSFNKEMITGLLREKYHFDGVVCTDWGIVSDAKNFFIDYPARAHGVMNLSPEERMLKIINAGVDQFGGESIPEMLIKLVKEGKITEERINISVRRILRDKFKVGLFDNPYVDVLKAKQTVGREDFRLKGMEAQRRSVVLLKNGKTEKILPLKTGIKIYTEGMDKTIAAKYATVVNQPNEADFAIVRVATPYQPCEGFIEKLFHHGDLDFKGEAKQKILTLLNQVPTVVDIYLDRPAVIPEIAAASAGLLADFGCTDEALLDIIFGKHKPEGKLPIEMPSSMEAVRNQYEDVPYDSKDPLFKFGFGLTYE